MKPVYWFVTVLMITALACGCAKTTNPATPAAEAITPTPTVSVLPQGTDGYPWWNDTTFYEIFVRSFYDSNGDGIGDFNGIAQKLDYLNDGDPNTTTDLGITGIWLMPINPSSTYHGYAVDHYYLTEPDYGTLDDLRNLIAAAHARGIRVIMDMVLNHTSNRNQWFIDSSNPGSIHRDWYIWSDTDPGYRGPWGQQVWFEKNDDYYYATFSSEMPDLNYANPEVTAEMEKVTRFWLEQVGIDGFRLDAAMYLIEEGRTQSNTESTHTWWKNYRTDFKSINPESLIIGEVWDETAITGSYLQGDQLDLCFDFQLADAFIQSVKKDNAFETNFQMKFSYKLLPSLRFAVFLTNHDQNRLMDQLGNDPEKVKAAAGLLLTSPGVPFIYYGEEIGMQGSKPDEKIRAPMQWSTEQYAGFSTANPWEALGADWESYNVATEMDDPASILAHYRTLIQIRNQHSALRVGNLNVISTGNNDVYAILRESQDESLLVLINLTDTPVTEYMLTLEATNLEEGSFTPSNLLGEGEISPMTVNSDGGFFRYIPVPEIPPYATLILDL